MKEPGVTRAERVFLNRITSDYKKDDLPNPEQIRYDAHLLVMLVKRLDEKIEKMTKREA